MTMRIKMTRRTMGPVGTMMTMTTMRTMGTMGTMGTIRTIRTTRTMRTMRTIRTMRTMGTMGKMRTVRILLSHLLLHIQFVINKTKRSTQQRTVSLSLLGRGGPSPSTKGRIQSPPPFVNALMLVS